MQLHQLKSPPGSRKRRRIVGRGRGSGSGCTSGRGENGQNSRSTGGTTFGAHEGGQSRLIRRLPKVGFTSRNRILNQVVELSQLQEKFSDNSVVNAKSLKAVGIISSSRKPFKILANGEITKPLVIEGGSVSKAAEEKLVKAGCKVQPLEKKISSNETTKSKKE